MINCHYCNKEIKADKEGNIEVAFIPETGMTIEFPICDGICLKKLRLSSYYDQPKKKWEKEFMIKKLKQLKKGWLGVFN